MIASADICCQELTFVGHRSLMTDVPAWGCHHRNGRALTVLEDMLIPTLMAKIQFLRINVSWNQLLLSTFASNVETTVIHDVDCVQQNCEMLGNIVGDC